jgi:serine/threonine-protein kinase
VTTGSGAARDVDLEERHRKMRTAFLLAAPIWSSFFALDLFSVLLLHAAGSLLWFAALRLVGVAVILVGYLVLRRRTIAAAMLYAAEMVGFVLLSALIAVMATRYGGLNSHYVQGVSLVVVYQRAFIPERFGKGVTISLLTAATFPLVMAIAARFDASIAAQWHDSHALAQFAHDYVFAIGTAVLSSIGGHFVWAARRQVFEARKLGRYRLKMRIGQGGMGDVWMAWDDVNNRDVALKILRAHAAEQAGVVARFEREARAAKSLLSPHSVRVFDNGASDDGVRYIAMELLDGKNLGQIVADHGAMEPARALHFIQQACASLSEAHGIGIIHRDIKPENLFSARVGEQCDVLKLLDFGIAKLLGGNAELDATLTHAGWIGGTPAYMAPEVCAGGEADASSDLYSLGAVLYFLLTGTPPFRAQGAPGLMLAHVREPVEPPSVRLGRALPVALEQVVMRCLEKRPKDRFPDVAALASALADCGVAGWEGTRARELWSAGFNVVK